MRRFYKHFLSKTIFLILPLGLFAVVCPGQHVPPRECKEKDYVCRYNRYMNVVFSECKAAEGYNYDCFVAQQTKIVEANPGDVAAYFYRGIIYRPWEPDRAIADFSKALELDPTYKPTYSFLASAYQKKGEHDRAIAVLNGGVELDPKDADMYRHRGYAYLNKRDFVKALADFNKVIELSPDSEIGYTGRAAVYSDQRDFDKALAEYNKAIEVKPKGWFTYYQRGLLYWKQGGKAKADADCQKAKELKRGVSIIPKQISEYCSL